MASVENRDNVRHFISEVEQTDDPRLAAKLVHDRILALNAEGKHIPNEFLLVQNRVIKECIYASQGR